MSASHPIPNGTHVLAFTRRLRRTRFDWHSAIIEDATPIRSNRGTAYVYRVLLDSGETRHVPQGGVDPRLGVAS